uniref:Uncharacterized protein C14orf166B homolog n=1 Tax=Saccoglossus kowalevskii TaxID=10224 RepID=A0ABM0MN98_SACKO|nr:PREDICTED: uncharacterized protein C14orf166B homolog [Saccoglossus kowalevskii]
MAENNSIRILDLSWNGFANEGALAMGQALKVNKQLIDLDLTNNRITNDGALAIAKGLESNDTLKVLKIGKNPISAAGAMAILMAISKNPQSALTDIRLTDIIITEEFEEMLKAIQKTRSDLRIEHGGTARHHGTNGAEIEKKSDPLQKLLDYVQKNNLRLLDLFQRFDKDKSMSVSREEFTKGIQSSNIPLKDSEINAIITMLDEDGDGEVDYGELVKGNKEILRKARERRNAKKKKEEFEERRVVEILASGVTEEERVKQVDAAWVDKEIREEMVDTGVETMRK